MKFHFSKKELNVQLQGKYCFSDVCFDKLFEKGCYFVSRNYRFYIKQRCVFAKLTPQKASSLFERKINVFLPFFQLKPLLINPKKNFLYKKVVYQHFKNY